MYREFYAIIKKTQQEKEDVVHEFTKGRTISLKEMTDEEFAYMMDRLRYVHKTYIPEDHKANGIRRAIISCFHKMNYKNPTEAAKAWALKHGVGAGEHNVKKEFNDYSRQELMMLLHKAQKAVRDFEDSLRLKLLKHGKE